MAFSNISINAIDLFCGAGGLSLGLHDAGINVPLGVEISQIAADTYEHNLSGHVLVDDIRNIDAVTIFQRLGITSGNLFLLAGCPPCQTFSSLQKDNTEGDERNNLIFEYVRLVRDIRPLFIQLENVPGLKTGRGKQIFKKATDELSQWYEITSDILNCADYGIPQSRKRLVLHGIRRDAYDLLRTMDNNFEVSLPPATHTNDPTINPNLLPWVTAQVAFVNLPPVAAGAPAPNGYPNHETNGLTPINIQRIQYIRTHGGNRTCLPPNLQLPCHSKGKVGFTDVYGIINPNLPSPTITGGCITYSKGRYGHPLQNRAITVREAARLQSFPDTYVFSGTRGQTALQVGNAVPPKLAEASGRYFMDLLNKLHQLPSEEVS